MKRILEYVGEAEAEAVGEYNVPRGELTLSAPIVFGRLHVVPVVTEFLSQFAEIQIRMTLTDRDVNLLDDHIDMAVRGGRPARQYLDNDARWQRPARSMRKPGLLRKAWDTQNS